MRPRPLLLGHRGARSTLSIPENTTASFELALAHGCDGFEFDVRLTGDGRAVVFHDPNAGGIVVSYAGPSDLIEVDLLETVIERFCEYAFLDIELKVDGLEERV